MTSIVVSAKDQLKELKNGVDEIISEEDLLQKLELSIQTQKPLILKLGADPSRPDLHLGHSVVLGNMRLMQDFGHHVKFLIGDFTAMIGDPTGKNKVRPQLSQEEVLEYAKTYQAQVFKILDPKKTEVVYNSHWLNALTPMDFVRLVAHKTVQQLLAREDFANRYSENTPIYIHELLYPIMQAYDSVVLKADIEFGGTDQRFNLLLGRELQKTYKQRPQTVVLSTILEGLDGVQKMSKSLDNYVGVDEEPNMMFGKIMSISDSLMLRYYQLLSSKRSHELDQIKAGLANGQLHPMQAKKDLAEEIVARFWDSEQANQARLRFESVFSKKEDPEDLAEHPVKVDENSQVDMLTLAKDLGFCESKGDARRVLKQNGMRLDGEVMSQEKLTLKPGASFIFKVGKLKIIRIIVE